MKKQKKMYRIWLTIIILAIYVILSTSVSSIPMGIVREPGLQTQNVKLIMIDGGSHSGSIVFRTQKKTIINEATNIVIGISEMNYDANHLYSSLYAVKFDISVTVVTLTGMQILMVHNIGDMKSVSLSILIISNDYRYASTMLISKVIYNYANSYSQYVYTSFGSITLIDVYPMLNGISIQMYRYSSTPLSFYFQKTQSMSGSTARLTTSIYNGNFAYSDNFVVMKLLLIKRDYIYAQQLSIAWDLVSSASTVTLSSIYDPNKSQIFMGLTAFYFKPGIGNLTQGLAWSITSTTTSRTFYLDDQITSFDYYIVIFTSYDCYNSSYPIQGYNGTSLSYECFNQCLSSQYEYYSPTYQDYSCLSCPSLCVGCYDSIQCKSCYNGYDLFNNGSCILNSTYYIASSVYVPLLCNSKFAGCETCTKYGHKCLTCQQGFYVLSSGFETYYITTGTGASAVTTPYTVLAVNCTPCSTRVANCLTCNSTVCFTCQSPTQLVTPTLCQIPTNEIFSILEPCTDEVRCKKCLQSALDDCLQCFDSELTLRNGKCMSPCGDGIVLDQEICDDGNILSYDGCASDCMTVETGWQCQTLPGTRKSYCQFIDVIPLTLLSIRKVTTQNKVIIMLQNSMPYIRDWVMFGEKELKQILSFQVDRLSNNNNNNLTHQQYDFKYTVKFTHDSQSTNKNNNRILQQSSSDSFDPSLYKFIELTIEYNNTSSSLTSYDQNNVVTQESLNHQPTSLKFSPSLSQMKVFAFTQESSLTFPLYTDENHMIQFYPPEYHTLYSTVKFVSMIVGGLMLIILLISVMSFLIEGNNSRQILLTVETASAVQLTYFSLFGIGELNPLFIALAEGLKLACGFDINLSNKKTSNRVLLGVSIQSTSILDNINVSLVLPVIFILIGVIVLIVSKFKSKRQQKNEMQEGQLMQGLQKQQKQEVSPHQTSNQNENHQQKQSHKQCKFYTLSKIFLINLGFGLFLFFLYKYLMSILIQMTLGQPQGTSFAVIAVIGILLLFFIVVMMFKFDLFSQLTQKLSTYLSVRDKLMMEDPEYAQQLQTQRIKKRKVYFLIIVFQRVINSVTLVLFYQSSFKLHGIVPVIVSLLQICYVYCYNEEIYNPPNKYRLYLNYVVTFVIQVLLLIRKLLLSNNEETVGAQESNYGLYLPFSVLLLLLIVELNGLVFLVYSIKKIRCCQLEIEWQRIDQTLEEEIKEKNVMKKKFNENLQASYKISKNLAIQVNQSVVGLNKNNPSNRNCSHTFKDTQMNQLNNRLQNSQREYENDLQKQQQIEQSQVESQLNQNQQKYFSNGQQSFIANQSEPRKSYEQKQQMNQTQNCESNKLTQNDIKKQLKNLLKEMKIPQLTGRNLNKNNSQKMQQITKKRNKNKGKQYHYTNQGIYNVYEEYDRI